MNGLFCRIRCCCLFLFLRPQKRMMSDFEVRMGDDDSPSDFYVKFFGPKDSPYEGGIWKIHVTLPATYPYKSPSIGFNTPIYHPNVDEGSGSVCLDVINQTWTPLFTLENVFSVFLPQLLLYPNPSDPLNGQAAALMIRDKNKYHEQVRQHVQRHATKDFSFDDDDQRNDDDNDKSSQQHRQHSQAEAAAAATSASAASSNSYAATQSIPNSNHTHSQHDEDLQDEEDNLSEADDDAQETQAAGELEL